MQTSREGVRREAERWLSERLLRNEMGRRKESPRQHEKVKVRRAWDHQSQKKKERKEFECERVGHRVNCSRRPGMVDLVRESLVASRPWDVVEALMVEVFVWLGTSLSSE